MNQTERENYIKVIESETVYAPLMNNSSLHPSTLKLIKSEHLEWLINQSKQIPGVRWELAFGTLTDGDLDGIKNSLSLQQRKEMETKCHELLNCMAFKDLKDLYLAEKMFEKGYLAASSFYSNEVSR
jgi:hypothetical protein